VFLQQELIVLPKHIIYFLLYQLLLLVLVDNMESVVYDACLEPRRRSSRRSSREHGVPNDTSL